jgi:imidazolonepropionase-like amidohydrolase
MTRHFFRPEFLDIRNSQGSLTFGKQADIIAALLNPLDDRQFMDQVNFVMNNLNHL